MTRLISDWINDMPKTMAEYDRDLKAKIGCDLRELALYAAATDPAENNDVQDIENRDASLRGSRVGVVRSNTGQGVISGFDRAVMAILNQIGVDAFTCERDNVDGTYEALTKGADILFSADDDRFLALNVKTGMYAENDYSTALGFACALEKMAGDLHGKTVAVLGYGKVGKFATEILTAKGAGVWVYDKKRIAEDSSDVFRGLIPDKKSLTDYKLFFDATNEEMWFDNAYELSDSFIVSPGIPLSFDPDKLDKSTVEVHDMLQIGTAVMLTSVL